MSDESAAQAIASLTGLVRDIQLLRLGNQPWARLLREQLKDVSAGLDLLRLTVAMERPRLEIQQAAQALTGSLKIADLTLAKTRAPVMNKAAVRLALGWAQRIEESLAQA